MATAARKKTMRDVDARLEEKRQAIFALMTPEDQKFFRYYDVGTLIALRRSERLNMLPGTQDFG